MSLVEQIKKILRPLSPSMENEYWEHQLQVISAGLKVVIVLGSILIWALALTIWQLTKGSEIRGVLTVALGIQIWLLVSYPTLDTTGRLRYALAYLTAVAPCGFIYFLFRYMLPRLPLEIVVQAQFIPIILVLLFYAFETLSVLIALSSGVSTSLIILYLRLNDPIVDKVSMIPVFATLLITNTIGIVLTIQSCYTSRVQFKLAKALEKEKEVLNSLIQRVFPHQIGEELRTRRSNLARTYTSVTIMFADLVNFTKITKSMEPRQLVTYLHELFHRFDHLAEKHGVEKIKTIGDAYMAAAGCPNVVKDHSQRIAHFSLELLYAMHNFNQKFGTAFQIRIGIHSGPVVGGVISGKRISFDIWGESVNLASRLEHVAEPGEIIVSDDAAQSLQDQFVLAENRVIDIKGVGLTSVHRLVGSADKNPYLMIPSSYVGAEGDAGELPFLSQH